jgi:serine kinase of HPr protein (carbohydrate metabolism regulator)
MGIAIKEILKESRLRLKSRTGEMGLSRELTTARIQKPGLLLTGLLGDIHPDRVQVTVKAIYPGNRRNARY